MVIRATTGFNVYDPQFSVVSYPLAEFITYSALVSSSKPELNQGGLYILAEIEKLGIMWLD